MKLFRHLPITVSLLTLLTIVSAGCGGKASTAAQPSGSGAASGSSGSSNPPGSSGSSGSPGSAANHSGIAVASPAAGAAVGSPFSVQASATTCSGQPVTSIGFSLDSGAATAALNGTELDSQAAATAGTHIVNIKSWGNAGATCSTQVTVNVTNSNTAANEIVPPNAVSVANIQSAGGWQMNHDPSTGSASSGSMEVVSSPSLSGNARQFNTSFTNYGGEIYSVSWGNDPAPSNFFYDGWVYLTSSASNILNLELDMNQVIANGDTIIYGFQCDGGSKTWDYTENAGTPAQPNDTWVHSQAYCDASQWAPNTWHHVQISYSRDDSGNVTYNSVWLDGLESPLNVTVPSEFALGWNPALLTNFQVDGNQSGSNTVYLDSLTISRW